MKTLFAICTLFCLLAMKAQAAEPVPNIVLILADDLGYGDVQHLNPQRGKIKTPHLDRLAQQGMVFTDSHSGSSVCTPTRYGLLTGRYAWRTRLQKGVLSNYAQPLIAPDRVTLPAMLQKEGYHTACIGKWHLGYTISSLGKDDGKKLPFAGAPLGSITKDGPTTRGFDHFFGFHHARMMRSVFENDRVTQLVDPIEMLPLLARRSSEYITTRAKTNKPFFLYLPLSAPHTPIVPSKDWQGKSGLGAYGDFVMETDWVVGQVMAALVKAEIEKNTLVIFTSDNGCSPAAGTPALEKEGHFASAEYRGYKSDIWDGGHRVPFFVRWPGKIKPGSQNKQMICHTDVMATCAELLKIKTADTAAEDSISFLPALLGKDQAPQREAIVHHSIEGKFSIRQGQWKLCLCAGSGGWSKGGGKDVPQLYDMVIDPGEKQNLANKYPDRVQVLTKLLETMIANGRSTPGKPQKNDVEVKIDKATAKQPQKE